MNKWNPVPNTGRINATNPCGEFVFLDDTSCNLASLNLMKFYTDQEEGFEWEKYIDAVRVVFLAQEILVGNARYPTEKISQNSKALRPIGLGYANLGALLMCLGHPYDSDFGREIAADITSVTTAESYLTSADIADRVGPFSEYEKNAKPFMEVMTMHRDAAQKLAEQSKHPSTEKGLQIWNEVLRVGERVGFRNAQATVIAPTGTISFMMDCATTGIEPDLSLIKIKKLVGGGTMRIANPLCQTALLSRGYEDKEAQSILKYIEENGTVEGSEIDDEDLAMFDCALATKEGGRVISAQGHLKMMEAVQPFVSGAISKTINLPQSATVEDIEKIYLSAWRMGLKDVAVYRDGSKVQQPLNVENQKKEAISFTPVRRHLPDTRTSMTHKFVVGGHEGYITVGLYEDGTPGEIFINTSKEGATFSGLMNTIATLSSICLQYGVPLEMIVSKFSFSRFEPSGMTANKNIPIATSVIDYIFRWLGYTFSNEAKYSKEKIIIDVKTSPSVQAKSSSSSSSAIDTPPCKNCGMFMTRTGPCYTCTNCGNVSGGCG